MNPQELAERINLIKENIHSVAEQEIKIIERENYAQLLFSCHIEEMRRTRPVIASFRYFADVARATSLSMQEFIQALREVNKVFSSINKKEK